MIFKEDTDELHVFAFLSLAFRISFFLFFLVHRCIVHIYIHREGETYEQASRMMTKKRRRKKNSQCLSIEKRAKKLHQYLMLFRVTFGSFLSMTTTIIHPNECPEYVKDERRRRDFFLFVLIRSFFFSLWIFSSDAVVVSSSSPL